MYVNSDIERGQLILSLDYPKGSSNWQWSKKFKLDQDQKNFLLEAKESGGGHAGCIGKLVMKMKRAGSAG